MPVQILVSLVVNGPPGWLWRNRYGILYSALALGVLFLVKLFSSGRSNPSERALHGKVVLLTGGTSGVGARVAHNLASRGAQLVLLTHTSPGDPFLAEYIQDLRDKYDNHLIYAEQVDLSSLHSIRKFATKWIDNAPPRRLDMIVLCAATLTPTGGERKETEEGIEETWMVNFLANFHLLGILSPAIRAQPMDRDVRVILSTCSSYIGAPSLSTPVDEASWSPSVAYGRSKLALNVFAQAFQKHLDAYKRPDGAPVNTKVICVDPGLSRTPGTRRWLTRGTLGGLALYMIGYFVPWLLLKSPEMGAQPFLYAAMESALSRGEGGKLVKECQVVDFARPEVHDEAVAKKLWEDSDALIERVEKTEAKKRASQRAERKEADKEKERDKERDKDKSSDKEKTSSRRDSGDRSDVESIFSIKKTKSRDKDRHRDKDKDKSRDKDKKKKRDKEKERERERERDKERDKDKSSDKEKTSSRRNSGDKSDVESIFSLKRIRTRDKDKSSDKEKASSRRDSGDKSDVESVFSTKRTRTRDKDRSSDKEKTSSRRDSGDKSDVESVFSTKRTRTRDKDKDKDKDRSDEGRSRRRSRRTES